MSTSITFTPSPNSSNADSQNPTPTALQPDQIVAVYNDGSGTTLLARDGQRYSITETPESIASQMGQTVQLTWNQPGGSSSPLFLNPTGVTEVSASTEGNGASIQTVAQGASFNVTESMDTVNQRTGGGIGNNKGGRSANS